MDVEKRIKIVSLNSSNDKIASDLVPQTLATIQRRIAWELCFMWRKQLFNQTYEKMVPLCTSNGKNNLRMQKK